MESSGDLPFICLLLPIDKRNSGINLGNNSSAFQALETLRDDL